MLTGIQNTIHLINIYEIEIWWILNKHKVAFTILWGKGLPRLVSTDYPLPPIWPVYIRSVCRGTHQIYQLKNLFEVPLIKARFLSMVTVKHILERQINTNDTSMLVKTSHNKNKRCEFTRGWKVFTEFGVYVNFLWKRKTCHSLKTKS